MPKEHPRDYVRTTKITNKIRDLDSLISLLVDNGELPGKTRSRAYIAGPMTGIENFNYPLFLAVGEEIRSYGYEVSNPAEREDTSLPWEKHMRLDIRKLMDCDVLVLLPGWGKSKGATLERTIAVNLGMPVMTWPWGLCSKKPVTSCIMKKILNMGVSHE